MNSKEILHNKLNGYLLENKEFISLSQSLQDKLIKWDEEKQPIERTKWTNYFLAMAYIVSTRSPDARTKHGIVLVNKNKSIIGTGYNGIIRGVDDRVLPNYTTAKYPFFIHSEINCLINCARHGIKVDNSIAYITGPPCFHCTQSMYQAGISMVYYGNRGSAMLENEEYKENMELFKWLTQNSMPIMHINFGEEDLQELFC